LLSLGKQSPPKNNIRKDEFDALKSLNTNHGIIVLRADKGGAAVISDKEDYQKKMLDHLYNSGSYKKLDKNPLKRISRAVSLAIKSSSTVGSFSHKLIESSPINPRIYGLPKIHKDAPPHTSPLDPLSTP